MSKHLSGPLAVAFVLVLAACGGGGGGGGPPAPAAPATVSLSANPTSVAQGGMTTLTWSSANASSCNASGGWSGPRSTTGAQQVGPIAATTAFALACGGVSTSVSIGVTPTGASVSGTLSVPATAQTDSDTNDIILTPVPNDSFQMAQALPNPVVAGGYANLPGTGASGPLQQAGDSSDYYRVTLLQGQVIELNVANPTPAINDLDLELYAANQTLVDASMGVSALERLTVAAPGQYFVRVLAFAGASNYILTIGQTGSTAAAGPLTLSGAFVPGDILVKVAPASGHGADAAARSARHKQLAGAFGLELEPGAPGAHALMSLTSSTMQQLARKQPRLHVMESSTQFASDEARLKWQTLQAIKLLSTTPGVLWAEPNWIYKADAVPNDPLYARQRWHYELISLPAAWDVTVGNSNVIAAVVDSGVRRHAELGSRLVFGYDFVSGADSGDGDGDDNDASDPGMPRQGTIVFHGTHVAGTIGAAGNDGQGVTGVAWNTRIMPVRVLGVSGSGSLDNILHGVLYAAGLPNRSGTAPAQRADVINLSLGAMGACPQSWQDVLNRVRAAGVIVVASAGNDGRSGDYAPAGCAGVISVSAIDADRTRAPYSNFGVGVDVAAPGGDTGADRNADGNPDGIFSTYATFNAGTYFSSFAYLQGTSMAAPHVSGVVALMKGVNPSLTPAAFDSLLGSGALTDDIGPGGPDALGVGMINALKAVRAASASPPARPAQLSVVPNTLNFGDVTTTGEAIVGNTGTAAINVTATTTSAPWLTAAPAQVAASGLGSYRIQVSRAGLAVGIYNGWVEFRGSSGTATRVTMLMQVASTPATSDAGQHYLLLIDPPSGDTRYQVEIRARGSSVDYAFANVAFGQYELVAGTDLNNDGLICDEGEACAEYPVFGEAQILDVHGDLSGLNMTTGFRGSAGSQANAIAGVAPESKAVRRLR